jgi:hypothetical protein
MAMYVKSEVYLYNNTQRKRQINKNMRQEVSLNVIFAYFRPSQVRDKEESVLHYTACLA